MFSGLCVCTLVHVCVSVCIVCMCVQMLGAAFLDYSPLIFFETGSVTEANTESMSFKDPCISAISAGVTSMCHNMVYYMGAGGLNLCPQP